MKIQNLIFFLFLSIPLQSQDFLYGYVVDQDSTEQILYASIRQTSVEDSIVSNRGSKFEYFSFGNMSNTDAKGAFHLVVDTTQDFEFEIISYGYYKKEISLDEIPTEPIFISLERDSSVALYGSSQYPYTPPSTYPSEVGMGLEFLQKDFSDFESILGNLNTKQLGRLPVAFTFDFGKDFNRFYTGVVFGFFYNENKIGDTLRIQTNQTLYAFQIGYKLIDAKHMVFMPTASAKLYRYRLINGNVGNNIPLNNYVENGDLDIRIRQGIFDFGATLGFKKIPKNAFDNNHLIAGLQFGIPIKMSKTPKINGLISTIDTDRKIEFGDFTIGIFLRTHIN